MKNIKDKTLDRVLDEIWYRSTLLSIETGTRAIARLQNQHGWEIRHQVWDQIEETTNGKH
jgi:hypothetical protein